MKISRTLLGWLIIIHFCCSHAQSRQSKIEVTRITDQIYKIFLNDVDLIYVNLIAYLSDEGILLVDSGLEDSAPEVQNVLNGLGGGKIRYIINTHSDGDHTFGNPLLGKDATIIAHENCREEMKRDARYSDEWLPTLTIKDELTIHFGDEVIHLVAMPCHTEDDIVVHFQKANILCVGDIIFTDSFSTIHIEKNGNLDKLVQVLKDLQTRYSPDTKVIVGHGEDITVADIAKYEKMTTETIAIVRKALQKKLSAEQMKTGEILKDWRSWESQLFDELNCELWIQNIVAFYNKKSENKQEDSPVLKGPYLGQNPPGDTPVLFAPGIVSSRYHEHSFPAFSPDYSEVYWTVGFVPGQRSFPPRMLTMKRKAGRWSPPQFAEFCRDFVDAELSFSPDGNRIFFTSNRPTTKDGPPRSDWDIWVMDRTPDGWSGPNHLGSSINTDKWEQQPTVANNGILYYNGYWEGGQNTYGIYRAELKYGNYSNPELLPETINSPHVDWTPFISSDESFLLWSSVRPYGYGSGDLYISFRGKDGSWTEAINLGPRINTEDNERYPYISPDGKYLFFLSDHFLYESENMAKVSYEQILQMCDRPGNGYCDIYWVDAKIIEELKPDELK